MKNVKGREYLYFSYYDREEKRKKEVYIGPKTNVRTIHRALQYNKEFLNLQQSEIHTRYRKIDKYLNLLTNDARNMELQETLQ